MEYPFLQHYEFVYACRSFVEQLAALQVGNAVYSFKLVEQGAATYVKIVKRMDGDPHCDACRDYSKSNLEVIEDDAEALVRDGSLESRPHVEYHILLSASYRVPVLYIFLRGLPKRGKSLLDDAYEWLVPALYKTELQEVGVMGGISYADHPVTGTPALFVHPCRTAEAMTMLASAESVPLEDYIRVWLGIVGSRVGLEVPSFEMAASQP